MTEPVTITATFSSTQAWALVGLLNRIGHDDLKAFATGDNCDAEAYAMLEACEVVRRGLANQGYDFLW